MGAEPVSSSRWVVWGEGEPMPTGFFDEEIPDEAAFDVIAGVDPAWTRDDSHWAVVLSATEDELQRWSRQAGSVHGYAPYEGGGDQPKVEGPRPY